MVNCSAVKWSSGSLERGGSGFSVASGFLAYLKSLIVDLISLILWFNGSRFSSSMVQRFNGNAVMARSGKGEMWKSGNESERFGIMSDEFLVEKGLLTSILGSQLIRKIKMKHLRTLFILAFAFGCGKHEVAYLGQKPPGALPELFAVSIVNTDSVELNAVFNNSMTEFFFTRIINGSFVIHHTELIDGQWTTPQPIQMFADTTTISTSVDMSLAPDGLTMYFLGIYPMDSTANSTSDIYKSQKVEGIWQPAIKVGDPISTDQYTEAYPVVVSDGSLYFVSDRPGGVGKQDIYRAQYLGNGNFDIPVSIGPNVNTELGSGDTYVAPDESYLISNKRHPDTPGLYVSFQVNGEWQPLVYLGKPINSEWTDFCPYMSPDGKYFFFSRRYSNPPDSGWKGVTEGEVYWVDASVIFSLNGK